MNLLAGVGAFARDVIATWRASLRRPPPGEVLREAYRIGVQSLPLLLVISVFIGSNLSIQGFSAFAPMGGQGMVGTFVAMAGVRELAPILAAAMVAAKAGTEMASALAVMRTREQVDALEVMGVDPLWWLVVPRLLGIVFVMPALTVVSITATVLAAWGVATWQLGLSGDLFLQQVQASIATRDLVAGIVKALLFGALICHVSCWFGLRSDRGPEGVGRATNRAVVVSAVAVVVCNALVSQVLYGG
ncbi:MAG: hypothetical protein RLZZ299_2035 [Pseudomonadota bacterium]|jgi:phospholipid/cholesterol/gamma-HCH transport system permease protein